MKDIAASVRARLLSLSRENGEPLDALMERYATGRFLYRRCQEIAFGGRPLGQPSGRTGGREKGG